VAKYPNPEVTVQKFWEGLQKMADSDGWTIVRPVGGRGSREFVARKGSQSIPFLVKVSQTDRGFWGLTPAQVHEPRGPILLLTGAYAGYFIPPAKLKRLLPQLSRAGDAIRVNEGKLRDQARFNTLVALWPLLSKAAIGGSA
jgi:hypothetical protein